MSILHVPVTASNLAEWVRRAAQAINQLITGKQDKDDQLTSLAALEYTGNAAKVIAVTAGEDGFELVAQAGSGSGIADGDYGDIVVSGSGTVLSFDTGVVTAFAKTFLDDADAAAVRTTLSAAAASHTHAQADITGLTTADSPQFTALNIGHASDTTLTRVSAGVAAIEGNNILTAASTISGRLIGVQIITATGAGTYTPTAGTNSIVIEMVGGGGGASGVASPTGSNGSRGASGGGGAYLRKRLTSAFSGAPYSVGAKGSGGAAGANNGSAGSDTTFTATGGGGTVYTAGGGGGGAALAATTAVNLGGDATAGGTATNGDMNIPGGSAGVPLILTATGGGHSGAGGRSQFSSGAAPARNNSANTAVAGNNATGYGGGGSAAHAMGTGAATAGGNGSDGILIIWEYS